MICLLSLQNTFNTFNRTSASVSRVHPPVRVALVPPPLTVCSVALVLYKYLVMTDLRELCLYLYQQSELSCRDSHCLIVYYLHQSLPSANPPYMLSSK